MLRRPIRDLDFHLPGTRVNGGNISSGENTLMPAVDMAGDYELSIANTLNGCVSTQTVNIIDTINTVQASHNHTGCAYLYGFLCYPGCSHVLYWSGYRI